MTDHICPKPGCEMEMEWEDMPLHVGYACPRNADAHELCAQLEAAKNRIKELESLLPEGLSYGD